VGWARGFSLSQGFESICQLVLGAVTSDVERYRRGYGGLGRSKEIEK
jgi:hypothetical protein